MSREPADLPELAWERVVVDGLRAEGITVTLVGGSKFETLLGSRLPARVFIVQAGHEGADVLRLEGKIAEVRVCPVQRPNGLWSHSFTVDGRPVPGVEGTQRPLYSVNDRFFVQAFGDRFDEAIRKVLGTGRPRC